MKTYLPLISISILVLFIACSKEDNIHALDLGVNYKSNILGFVTDEDSLPIEGAMVNYNGSVKLTDKHGVYAFTNVDVNSKNSFIKIAKSGYFDSGRSFSTGNSSNIRVSNILSRKLFDLNFDSNSNGGTGTNEFQVLFQENSLLYEQNTSLFKGFFEIAGKYIDPTQVDMSSKMPGNLNGISNSNEISKLTPYGIINIDLQTTKGEKLILQPGKQIKLSLLIPPTLVFNTPSSISMWYFNDSLGYWIEEGKSVLTGNTYQGNIKHTGCWCYASSKPSVNIFGRLTDQFGIPLSSELKITKSHEEIGTYIHTNIDGSFSSPVNKDEYFTIYTYFQASGGNLYYKVYSFGPYIKDIAIEPMQINFYDPGTYSFKATFKDCKDNLIQNGYVKIIQGTDSHYFQIINGQVEASFRTFDINVSSIITALNLDNFTETIPVNLIGSGLHDLGVVIIC